MCWTWAVVAGSDDVEQQLRRGGPHLDGRLVDGRERDRGRTGEVDVVVADDRHVVGHADAGERQSLQDAESHEVVGGEDGVGALSLRQVHQLFGAGSTSVGVHGDRLDERELGAVVLIDRGSCRGEAVLHLRQARRAADEPDPAAADGEEVLGGEQATGLVVDGDRRELLGPCHPVDQHHARAAITQAFESIDRRAHRGDQDAAHPLLLEQVEIGLLALAVLGAAAEDQGSALLPEHVFDASGDVGEERVRDVEHDHPDGLVGAGSQLAGRVVADVPQLVDGRLDPLEGRGQHLVRVVQRVGHRPR